MRAVLAIWIAVFAVGCGLVVNPAVEPAPVAVRGTSIERGLAFLAHRQVTPEQERVWGRDWAGNWPQFVFERDTVFPMVREVSPFLATFICDALSWVREDTVASLGLSPEAATEARTMRCRAVALMKRFAICATRDGDRLYGFWPRGRRALSVPQWLVGQLAILRYRGAAHYGVLAPYNAPSYPTELMAWTDADDTAVIYAALADHARAEGHSPPADRLDRALSYWRDDGRHNRTFPRWMAQRSGLYLTWLFPDCRARTENDIDLVVNANVLYALARLGQTAPPEVAPALIAATRAGRHHRADCSSKYYADRALYHWLFARAYADGPVPALRPAVEILADELQRSAVRRPDGLVYWRGEVPERETALALLTLMRAGRFGSLVDGGVAWLRCVQDPVDGGWRESVFCEGPTMNGPITEWRSRSFTTAVALEALIRHRLHRSK